MFKRLSAIILIILVLLGQSACSGNEGKNNEFTAPSYSTRDIIIEELGLKYAGSIKMNSKSQLVIYDGSDGSNRYITVDGDGNIANEIKCDLKGDGSAFAFDENNNLYILVQDYIMEENGYKVKGNTRQLVIYDAGGGKLKDIEMGKAVMHKDENIYVDSISIDSKGNIYLVKHNEPLELADKDGKPLESPISGIYGFLDIDENGNIIAGVTGSGTVKPFIACIDPGSGKEIWKKHVDTGVYIYTICYNKAEKCTYALTDVTTLNTELMAGKGPDIIYFADLPYKKYIDKNMFVNLGELMKIFSGNKPAEETARIIQEKVALYLNE